jgi:hypothetical protein
MIDQENQTNNQDLPKQQDPVKVQEPNVGSSPNPEKQKKDDPPYQQESDKLKEQKELIDRHARRPANPSLIIKDCLRKSFKDDADIKEFCSEYFEYFCKEIKETDRFSEIIQSLITYCDTHGEIEHLWSLIKEQRIEHYEKYYSKWKQMMVEYQSWQESREQFIYKPGFVTREKPLVPDGEDKAHPLSGNNRAAINGWFYNELGSQEKSMVLTVALFEGINRKLMIPISQEIERRLFETT